MLRGYGCPRGIDGGLVLTVIRERSGLSQAELARLSGVSQGHISQPEALGARRCRVG